LDPIFAILIGTSAAFFRIRREEIEKGNSGGFGDIITTFQRRIWEKSPRANGSEESA